MNEISPVLLITNGMTSLLLRLCMERLQSALLQELAISHITRTVFVTGGDAGHPGRGRPRDECTHTLSTHTEVGSAIR